MTRIKTLSEQMGLGRKETAVTALIAAALRQQCGDEFLAALLDEIVERVRVIDVFTEYPFGGNRFDVVVVYEDSGVFEALIVEVKVTSDEGGDQLRRYLEAAGNSQFLQGLSKGSPKVKATGKCVESARVLYLTVERQQGVAGPVIYRTFEEWYEQTEESASCTDLASQLLKDLLAHLGPERADEVSVITSMGADTTLSELRDVKRDGIVLSKKIASRVVDVIAREFAKLNVLVEERPFVHYWTYRGQGGDLELGYYKSDWDRYLEIASSDQVEGLQIAQVLNANLGRLSSDSPSINLAVRFQAAPYRKKKELEKLLEDSELEKFYGLKWKFWKTLKEEAGSSPRVTIQRSNSYLQVAKAKVDLDPEDSLAAVAKKIWVVALEVGGLMDAAIAKVDQTPNPRVRVREKEDPRFSALAAGQAPDSH